jgi:VWFA-related protein
MRTILACITVVAALAVAGRAAQDAPDPVQVFRERVDLITVDVAALDSRGRPVEDLREGDFTVKVDGKQRKVVSADLIKVDQGRRAASARPVDALIATNVSDPQARRVVIAVDQTLIAPGGIKPLLRTASQFVDRMPANDSVAFIGFPEPGPRIDFTTDRARLRQALDGIVGHPAKRGERQFNIAVWEGFALTGAERPAASMEPVLTGSVEQIIQQLLQPPTTRRILERGCEGRSFDELTETSGKTSEEIAAMIDVLRRCRSAVFRESMMVASDARQDAKISLAALENLLKDLALIEGPKTMLVMSAGLVNDDPSILEEVRHLAAAARTTINVIAVEPEREQEVRSFPASQAGMMLVDRSIEMQGLEIIADSTGGSLYRAPAGTSEGVFKRIESELSAWYLVAVERQHGDPDRQRIDVEVKRKGVTVRANKTFVSTAAIDARRPMEEVLRDALSSSLAVPGIPLRVSTFAQRDPAPGKYRLRLAVQIGQPGTQAGEYALGYALLDDRGRVVTSSGSRRTLSPPAKGLNPTLHYDTAVSVDPGLYSLRFGIVDKEGRRGTVVRRVELPKLDSQDTTTSDLIVGNLPAEGEVLRPSVDPQVVTGELAGYVELYLADTEKDGLTVTLEVAEGESSPALATETLTLRPGEQPSWRVAAGYVDIAISPGPYLARAVVRRNGEIVRTVSRPFTVVRDPSVAVTATARVRAVPVSKDLQTRTAAYVAGVVNGLANLVAQEEFELSKPDRKVTSDLLLVRYPGSQRDLISYRDVSHVNGKPLPGRDQRLVDLFVAPTDSMRERARQIMSGADAYVPSAFNPMFVIGFLQSDFQSRFELMVGDAGPEWPREVKAVTFVETARPTLLRSGPFGDVDTPSRGTAWIEEGTGRILQTELQLGRGRPPLTVVTQFKVDDRLQVTVPVQMRTRNPDGVATYSNFRRFGVQTNTVIPGADPESKPNQR